MNHGRTCALACLTFLAPALVQGQEASVAAPAAPAPAGSPAFGSVPELTAGFNQLYEHKFPEARAAFVDWQSQHRKEAFAAVAMAASSLYGEIGRQGALTC